MFDDSFSGGGCDLGGGFNYGAGCSYDNSCDSYFDDDPLVYATPSPGIMAFNPAAPNAGIGFAALAIAEGEAAVQEINALADKALNDAAEQGLSFYNTESTSEPASSYCDYAPTTPHEGYDDGYAPAQAPEAAVVPSALMLALEELPPYMRILRATINMARDTLPFEGVVGSDGWPAASPAELSAMSLPQAVAYETLRSRFKQQLKDTVKYWAYFDDLGPRLALWSRGASVMADVKEAFGYEGEPGAAGWVEPTEIEFCDFSDVKQIAYERIKAYCMSVH